MNPNSGSFSSNKSIEPISTEWDDSVASIEKAPDEHLSTEALQDIGKKPYRELHPQIRRNFFLLMNPQKTTKPEKSLLVN